MSKLIRLAPFDEAAAEVQITGYPSTGRGSMAKTVDELDAALGTDLCASDWDTYVRLAGACLRDITFYDLERSDAPASDSRKAEFLRAESMKALRRAKTLHGEFVEERRRDLERDGSRVQMPGQSRDFNPATGEHRGGETGGARWCRSNDGQPAAVARGERFAEHRVVAADASRNAGREEAVVGQHGSFGGLIRSMSTTSGSALVPTIWSADIIDRARNNAAVIKAGATMVPMDAKIVQIGRLTADPTASFRTEGSTITASDPTFDNVTLTATTLSALVIGSLEWFQDAPNVDEVVSEAVGKAVALQLDLASLFGGLTTGSEGFNLATPPNPRGILATLLAVASSNVLGAGANGTAQTALSYWNEVLDTIYQVKDQNEDPQAMIWSSKLARQYAKAYDSQGRILTPPPDVDAIQKFVSNQIPSFTQGTMTSRATDLFVGDFRELIIGQRLDFQVQTLVERYAELGQIGILATWRGDVQLARPRAFSVYRYLQGA